MSENSFWDSFPIMRFFVILAFGCILGFYAPISPWWLASMFVVGAGLFAFFNFRITKIQEVKHWQTWSAGLLLFAMGWLLCSFYLGRSSAGFFGHSHEQITAFEAIIKQEPAAKPTVYRFTAQVTKWRDSSGNWRKANGRIWVYVFRKQLDFEPAFGDRILVLQKPVLIQTAVNPGDFDFRTYLSYQGIYYQAHVPGFQAQLLERNAASRLEGLAIVARQKSIEIIQSTITSKQEASVALALVLGVKSFIDPELRNAYQSAGAMHVLAVSGMHIGLVFGALTLIFGFIKRYKGGVWTFSTFILLILWSYSLITGFSASVLRAVTMCSFVLLANSLGKHHNMFNILGIAGFVLLMFQPTILFDVGFQLSFAAVFGIFLIYPVTGYLFQTNQKIVSTMWKISCVAFAAQLLTFPLSIFYFNQFPNYFLLSNLAIVPTSTLAMYTSLANVSFSWVPGLSFLLGKLAQYSIWLLNKSIFITESMPHATTRFLYVNVVETIWIYLCLGLIITFVFTRRKNMMYASLAAVCLYSFGRLYRNVSLSCRESAIVYRIPGHTLMGYFKGTQGKFWGDRDLINNKAKLHYHIDRHIAMLGLKEIDYQELRDTNTYVYRQKIGSKSVLVVNHLPPNKLKILKSETADLVLVRSVPHVKNMDWLNDIDAPVWLLDASVLKPKNKVFATRPDVWNVLNQGPYFLNFSQ